MGLRGDLAKLGIEANNGATTGFPNGIETTSDISIADSLTITDDLTVSGLATIAETLDVTGETTVDDLVVGGLVTIAETLAVAGVLTPAGGVARTAQEYVIGLAGAKVGATGGWTVDVGDDKSLQTVPQSQTASTLVIPITGIKVGSTITSFKVVGQIESAGNTATLDADLRKHTTAAGDVADASVGAITQISVTADTAIATAKTGLTEVVAATETFYVLLTATTAASTDVALQGITITVTEA